MYIYQWVRVCMFVINYYIFYIYQWVRWLNLYNWYIYWYLYYYNYVYRCGGGPTPPQKRIISDFIGKCFSYAPNNSWRYILYKENIFIQIYTIKHYLDNIQFILCYVCYAITMRVRAHILIYIFVRIYSYINSISYIYVVYIL